MTVEIRRMGPDDLPGIRTLYRFLHHDDPALPDDRAMAVYDEMLAMPGMTVFLLEDSGAPRASCVLNVIPNLTRGARPYGVIENVVTHPDHRCRGHDRAVLQHALDHAWDHGCYKVMLMTGQEELRPFYESCGFDGSAKHAMLARRPDTAV